jgi:cytochrome c
MGHVAARFRGVALIGLAGLLGCGGGKEAPAGGGAPAPPSTGGLSPYEMENGIGPVRQAITVGPIDKEMAEQGQKLFEAKCTPCHKLDQRYVGPSLGGVTIRRTPTYVMNMILDPTDMTEIHPVAKDLLGQFMTQMPNLGLTQDQARSIVEYFRSVDAKSAGH